MPVASRPAARPLPRSGTDLTGKLSGGAAYALALREGEAADLRVEQLGVDLVLRLLAPDDRLLRRVDSPNGAGGEEVLPFVAASEGTYRVEIAAPGTSLGSYRLQLAPPRSATLADRRRSAAEDDLSRAEELRRAGGEEALRAALPLYARALAGFGERATSVRAADAHFGTGRALAALGEVSRAAESFGVAVAELRALGDRRRLANALNGQGLAAWAAGRARQAIACHREALALFRTLGEAHSEAASLLNLGESQAALGEVEEAFASFEQALALWQRLGARGEAAITESDLGQLYFSLGDAATALDTFERVLPALTATGLERHVAVALGRRGNARVALGDAGGLDDLAEALARERRLGNRRQQAVVANDLALAHRLLGRPELAEGDYEEALRLLRELGDRRSEATTLANLGWLRDGLGRPRQALADVRLALARSAELGEPGSELADFALARCLFHLGDLAGAQVAIDRSLARVEEIRERPAGADLRGAYQEARQEAYAFAVELAMARQRAAPGAAPDAEPGFAARAFALAERARARGLLDGLALGAPRAGSAAAVALRQQADDLVRRLEQPGEDRQWLLARYHRLRAAERLASPAYASLVLPRPLRLGEVQRLLAPDVVLLEYHLGEPRSFLWVVTADRFAAFELPGRMAIEPLARRAHALLAASHQHTARAQAGPLLAELSRLLLGPAAPWLGGRRIVLVPDGALWYLPFGALPAPDAPDAPPLSQDHELSSLPSASILAALRARESSRARAPRPLARKTLALFADPVTRGDDPRLPHPLPPMPALDGPARLPFSAREAEEVLALVPPAERLAAVGFDAALPTLRSTRLADFRLLHFATHGVLDNEHPALSGLVLSQFDRTGRALPGTLRATQIEDLDLAAELVVVSACRTALGKETRSEGLVGLARSFFAAGAQRVLVSLWPVDDRATAVLMARFYQGLLAEGRSPAAALQAAQASLRREPGWSAPYFWAGFVLQGDDGGMPWPR